jgi:hypothetical protein
MKQEHGLLSMIAAGLLSACGGGGGNAPANGAPTMAAQGFAATEDTAFQGNVVATDPGDTLTYSVVSNPANGSLSSFTASGNFTYQPAANFNGADTFSVRVTDSANQSATATMTMNVAAVNDTPVANSDRFAVTSANFNVLANDTDVETAVPTVSIVGNSFPAGATVGNDGSVSFPVASGFKGVVKFRYRITDAGGATAEADAVGFVNIVPFKAVFIGRPAGAPDNGSRIYVNDFLSTYPADDDRGPRDLRVASNGNQLSFRVNTSGSGTQMFAVNLAQPTVVHTVGAEMPAGIAVNSMQFTPDGRYLVYSAGDAAGTAIYRYDTQAAGTPAARISPAATEMQFATAPRFNPEGTMVYYGGRAPANGASAAYRTNLASAATTRVSRLQTGTAFDEGIDFAWPLPDESKVIVRFLEDGPIPNNYRPVVLMNLVQSPDIDQYLHLPPPAGVIHGIPLVSPDGQYVVHTVFKGFSVSRTDTPNTETWMGIPALQVQGLVDFPDRERVMRTDSQASLLVGGCGDPVNYPNLPCNVYEVPFADPANAVPVHPLNAPGYDSRDPAYSYDGARVFFRHLAPNSPTRLMAVHRGAFSTQQAVSAADDAVLGYKLDFSGYAAAYLSTTSDPNDLALSLANVDVPGEALDLGIVDNGADYYLVAY